MFAASIPTQSIHAGVGMSQQKDTATAAADRLLDRITTYLATGLPNGWTGTVALDPK